MKCSSITQYLLRAIFGASHVISLAAAAKGEALVRDAQLRPTDGLDPNVIYHASKAYGDERYASQAYSDERSDENRRILAELRELKAREQAIEEEVEENNMRRAKADAESNQARTGVAGRTEIGVQRRRSPIEETLSQTWYDVDAYEDVVEEYHSISFIPWPCFLLGLVFIASTLMTAYCYRSEEGSARDPNSQRRPNDDLGEDIYGFAICSLCHDTAKIAEGDSTTPVRSTRVVLAIVLVYVCMFVQVFIQFEVGTLCTNKWVHDIRAVYDAYQVHMCGGTEHTTLTVNDHHRCKEGYFDTSRFASFSQKSDVCNVPFSQPPFLGIVCLIWTLTCLSEVKITNSLFSSLIIQTKTGETMKGAIIIDDACEPDDEGHFNEQVIAHLTRDVKLFIVFGILLPRLINTTWLLYLGTRWISATFDFSEMVLNAVALEFIMLLKDLLYTVLVPERNKREVRSTNIRPPTKYESASYSVYLGSFLWGCLAVLWVAVYMLLLQRVLPEYRWDVQDLCYDWMHRRNKV